MKINDKRGISTVVATVLIVLITVAAVTILWVAISPLIGQDLGSAVGCLKVNDKIALDSNVAYSCYDDSQNMINYRVERRANSPDLAGFEVYIEHDGVTLNVTTVTDLPMENGNKRYSVVNDDFNGLTETKKISIAPMINVDGVPTACSDDSFVVLSDCP